MCDIELVLAYKTPQGYADCSRTLEEYKNQIRAEVIDDVKEKLNSTGVKITFDLPVEKIIGEVVDLDDFTMLVKDAVQAYRKTMLGVLEQLKEQK